MATTGNPMKVKMFRFLSVNSGMSMGITEEIINQWLSTSTFELVGIKQSSNETYTFITIFYKPL